VTEEDLKQKLLVKSVLEAVLAKSSDRFDLDGRDQRLKAATLLECADKGYVGLTIADISKRSRVSTATIYAGYRDREALLVAAIEMLLAILAEDVIEAPTIADPLERVQLLLVAHGLVYAQPFATWLFRLYISLTWHEHRALRDTGARVFTRIDAFWEELLAQLVADGDLASLDVKIVAPILLGPMERWSILSRLSCGEMDRDEATLFEVAAHSARSLFAVWGTDTFWRARSTPRPGVAAMPAPPQPPVPASFEVASLAARQAASLETGEEPTTAQRRERILLAAALECQERGYNDASVSEIAARAGVSLATLYKHGKDKTSLYIKVLESEIARAPPTPLEVDLATALIADAYAATAPDRAWILNLTMASELSAQPAIVAMNHAQRAQMEAAYGQRLDRLEGASALAGQDRALLINFVLGGVERSSVFAHILFGPDAVDPMMIAAIADASADAARRLLRVAPSNIEKSV
jgi:TetR/AcrR family transcriptional regulator, transcriptional repressor of aconitase